MSTVTVFTHLIHTGGTAPRDEGAAIAAGRLLFALAPAAALLYPDLKYCTIVSPDGPAGPDGPGAAAASGPTGPPAAISAEPPDAAAGPYACLSFRLLSSNFCGSFLCGCIDGCTIGGIESYSCSYCTSS
ncbi:hypothetical protein A7U60_g1444 [Sanghuangporus baumii]|uniref:Uncharacterized protein n=1 Tax=Sanghuangporus baumii TaxID=108892 RepID=A0A9Q5I4M8_SANBA|nr:hypothetical protein A7U60_g1444 [Sanghuangporus baumii]